MELTQDAFDVIVAISILIGVIYCFFGYRVFKIILGILGFAIGAPIIGSIVYGATGEEGIALVAAIIGGLVCALLIVALYFIGIFILGAGLGWLLGNVLAQTAGATPSQEFLIAVAIIGGIIALVFQKFMIIVTTAFSGAWTVITGIFYFARTGLNPFDTVKNLARIRYLEDQVALILVLWILIGSMGVYVQYIDTRKKAKKKELKKVEEKERKEELTEEKKN